MTKIEETVVIGTTLEKVYAFAADWHNLKRYFLYVHDIKPVNEKVIGVGAQYNLTVKFLGRMMTSDWECIELLEKVGWTFSATLEGKGIKAMALCFREWFNSGDFHYVI